MHIKLFILSVLIFASLNPKDVSAATLEPPKVYVDGIVRIAHTERLAAIPLPELTRQPIAEKAVYIAPVRATATSSPSAATTAPKGNGANGFAWGWCTYYAQSQRTDKKFSGNARDWLKYSNSKSPRVGSVAVNTNAAGGLGHVAIVTAVEGGRVQVKHMNYKGFGVISTDWTPASYWSGYIL